MFKTTEKITNAVHQCYTTLYQHVNPIGTISLPYHSDISEKISAVLKNVNVRIAHVPLNSIGNFFSSFRHKYSKFDLNGVVYEIPYKGCSSIYIGETGRSINARLKEHKNSFNKGTMIQDWLHMHLSSIMSPILRVHELWKPIASYILAVSSLRVGGPF